MPITPYYFARQGDQLRRVSVGGDPLRVTKVETVGPIGAEWALNMSFPFVSRDYADIAGRRANGDIGVWIADVNGQFGDVNIIGNIPLDWQIQFFAPFHPEGAIYLLAHYRSGGAFAGKVHLYEIRGITLHGPKDLGKIIFPDWDLHFGDIDGDGTADIVGVRNVGTSREVHVWYIDTAGAQLHLRAEKHLGNVIPEGWTVHLADMNGDGCADIFGTTAANDLAIWFNEGPRGDRINRRLVQAGVGKLGSEWQQPVLANVDRAGYADVIAQSTRDTPETKNGTIGRWLWNGAHLQAPNTIGVLPGWTIYAGGGLVR